jgi:tryptophan-rich sensory protein
MDWGLFAIFLAACGAAAATGAMFQPGDWYKSLSKPGWTPPDWLFPIAWTILYISSAVAAARVGTIPGSQYALAFWALQIALNTLWSPVFFGLNRMRAAMVIVVFLWLAVCATMIAFFQLDTLAGALFVPYLLWVTVASALNASIVQRNPAPAAP